MFRYIVALVILILAGTFLWPTMARLGNSFRNKFEKNRREEEDLDEKCKAAMFDEAEDEVAFSSDDNSPEKKQK